MLIDPSKNESLDQHGEKPEGNDDVFAVHGQPFVVDVEQH